MLMLRSTHERLMAEALARADAEHESSLKRITGLLDTANASLDNSVAQLTDFAQKFADFADRTVPPKVKDVKQPLTIEAADANAAKRLKGVK